jgi:long-chain-fatty-acid--CoA ligase ACSBG
MLSLQFIWSARNGGGLARLTEAAEVFVSYLPLSHVAAQILDIFVPMLYAVTVYFAQPDALKVNFVSVILIVTVTRPFYPNNWLLLLA